MHYTGVEVDGTTYHINHNSDWSGEAIINWIDRREDLSKEVRLPGKVLLKLGFEAGRQGLHHRRAHC